MINRFPDMDTYFTEINHVLLASRGYEYDGFLDFHHHKGLIFPKWLPLPWKRPKCTKKIEKDKNDHSRLLAQQKLMKLDRNNIHI
jgi:hypothetical protein